MCEDGITNRNVIPQTNQLVEMIDQLYADHNLAEMPPERLRDNYDADDWQLCKDIIAILKRMTVSQRYAAMALRDGLWG